METTQELKLHSISLVHNPLPGLTIELKEDNSMLEIARYVRKPFDIDAVQITEENIAEVAKWAGGDVRKDRENKPYIKIRVFQPKNSRQTKGYVGDWVLYAGTGYKVYTPKAFENSFELADPKSSTTSVNQKAPKGVKAGTAS